MILNCSRSALSAVSVAVLAMLSACGGSSSGPSPQATADSASVPWNAATALDVTSNDAAASGAALAVQSQPAHGTASVQGGKIVYTPTAGYFGADSFSYLLGNSSAQVNVTVLASMTIQGTVHDDAMPGAQVVLSVDGVAQPAVTADADGNYTLTVTTANPNAFLSLQATGVGAQSNVALSSLVGDAASTAAAADSQGAVSAQALPAANVTNVSTAVAVLSQQALGKAPASTADLLAAQGQFTAAQAVQMAAAIKLVADSGVALPSGSANTLALVSNPAAYTAFVTDQATHNATAFTATQNAVLADPSLAVAPPAPATGSGDVTLLVTLGQGAGAQGATRLTMKADGTATIGGSVPLTAHWTTDGGQITVTYDAPYVYENNATASDGRQYLVNESDTGFKLRQLSGPPGAGPATLDTLGSITWEGGPSNGQTATLADNWVAETMVGQPQAIVAADVAVGTEWAGFLTTDFDPSTSNWTDQDVLKIVDATHVLFERTNVTGTWALNNGALEVTTPAGLFRYTRLFTGPKGEERWLDEHIVDGTAAWSFDAATVKVTPGLAFTAASAAHDWRSYVNAGLASSSFYIDLAADGTGVPVLDDASGNPIGSPYWPGTWTIAPDGSEVFTRSYCNDQTLSCGQGEVRSWTLLATAGSNIYVMERLQELGSMDQYRINVYTDADH
ncbi:MAG TPA: Ig-like domain-containing protein [Burkholderiaceae bacterium]